MNPELLAELRDIHEPLAPLWWPPAPGWWLIAIACIAALVFGVRALLRIRRRNRPYRVGRDLFSDLEHRLTAGAIEPRAFVDLANELLKRLLIHVEGRIDATRATGDKWQRILAERYDEPAFAGRSGRLLGRDRFRPSGPSGDIGELVVLLRRTFDDMRPPTRHPIGGAVRD